jgi:large subunit ribosomal protein L9
MKVILLKSVQKVGKKGDIIEVAAGYAQHALFPKKFAVLATPQAIALLERQKQNDISEKEIRHSLLTKAILELANDQLVISVKANEQGSLFSKITAVDIASELMTQKRISIDPELLTIAEGTIKKLGTYVIGVSDQEYQSTFTIKFIAA